MTWPLQSDGKEQGEDRAEEAEASRRKRREHERFSSTVSTEQGLYSEKKKKNHFLCALLFIFPVAFILINAVIQQVVGELLPLGNSRLLPQ